MTRGIHDGVEQDRTRHDGAKQSKVHFLTAYLEYLYDQGIKSEEYYLGDASRFIRFLLARVRPEDVEAYLAATGSSGYQKRRAKTLKKFSSFAKERLGIDILASSKL